MSMEISQNVTLGKTILLIIQTYIIFIFNLFFFLNIITLKWYRCYCLSDFGLLAPLGSFDLRFNS